MCPFDRQYNNHFNLDPVEINRYGLTPFTKHQYSIRVKEKFCKFEPVPGCQTNPAGYDARKIDWNFGKNHVLGKYYERTTSMEKN